MSKSITRTFKFYKVTIKDGETGGIVKEEVYGKNPSREKVAIAFIKESGKTNFTIDIVESEEQREMSVETFIFNSTLLKPVEPKS